MAVLEAANYDIELTGAWLLGKDAASMASQNTKDEILSLISGAKKGISLKTWQRHCKALKVL